MSSLSLSLLGPFEANLDGRPLGRFRTRSVQALLVYLACQPEEAHRREALMALLWPGLPQASAQASLRQCLYLLRKAISEVASRDGRGSVPFLSSDRQTIRINPDAAYDLDTITFTRLLRKGIEHWHEATTLYRGDFLTDFYLPDSEKFEEWTLAWRQDLRRQMLDALDSLAARAIGRGDSDTGASYARRQLEIDNLREQAHHQLMEALALSGQRMEALSHFNDFRQLLQKELSVEPSANLLSLHQRIVEEEISAGSSLVQGTRGYELGKEIGAGAYGVVYRARQPAVGREVAIKVIRPEHANQPEFIQRFEAEAQMVARLEYPHIVPVYDYWRDDSGAYLVIRLLGGGSLKDMLRSGPLSIGSFLQLVYNICGALSAAHTRGIVHRDIKPSNILFDEDGNAYLTDFGIAKNLEAEVELTPTGAVLGTPDYISPEQIKAQELTPAADQYSLGIVLFEALTGRVPFPDESIAPLFHKHLTEPIPLLATVNPDLPPDLDPILQRATAKEPADRYPDILALAEALQSAAGGQPSVVSDQSSEVTVLPPFLEETEKLELTRPVFVGRDAELTWLSEKLNRAVNGPGQVTFVAGDAGAGKSALLSAFARRALDEFPGLLVAQGTCNAFTGSGDPYLPFRGILSTLTGDVESRCSAGTVTLKQARMIWNAVPMTVESLLDYGPDLIDTFVPVSVLVEHTASALPTDSPVLARLRQRTMEAKTTSGELEQPQLFEQVAIVLIKISETRPLLLLIDDLQWADSGSINLLFHLGRRLSGARILLVCACRQDEVTAVFGRKRHPLLPLIDEFKRTYGEAFLDLNQRQEKSFVDSYVDSEPNDLDDAFRDTLYAHTGGHPLFTVELLRNMQERGDLVEDDSGLWTVGPSVDWDALPARVEGAIEARINRLEEELREILNVAAVEGQDFTAQVVAGIQELEERRLLRSLSRELEKRHRLVHEKSAVKLGRRLLSRYSFTHALFQQYLYNDLSDGERRMLHGDIAIILEELYAERLNEITVQLAWHYSEAGDSDKALPYLLQAGDNARALYAFDEAIQHYERALGIYKEQGDYDRSSRILMNLGLTYHSAFDYERSGLAYEESFRLQQQSSLRASPMHLAPAPHALRMPRPDVLTLDPGKHSNASTTMILDQLFSGLIYLTPDMNVMPDVARSWEVLNDGQTYLFHLRDDVRWSDGEPVTAHDFVLGWCRTLDPANGSPAASNLYDVRGATALHQGDTAGLEQLGVKALDDLTLKIDLEQPSSYFLYVLSSQATIPVPGHIIASHGDAWTDPDHFVSNGPFRLESYEKGRMIVLRRNPTYHGPFLGNLEMVQVRIMSEMPAELDRLVSGYENDEYDIMNIGWLPPAKRHRAIQRNATDYFTSPILATIFVSFDVSHPPFEDLRVRQAFVLAIDRQELAVVTKMSYGPPVTGGFIPLGMPGHVPGIALPFDLEQARRLLGEAGYPGGEGFPKVTALVPTVMGKFIEAVLNQWRSRLGIEISCELLESNAFFKCIHEKGDLPHIYSYGWAVDYPDPDSMMRLGKERATNWGDEAYDALVEQARRVLDQNERMRLYRQAEEILVREAPFFPLYYNRWHLLVKPWIRNYRPLVNGPPAWKDVIIDPH